MPAHPDPKIFTHGGENYYMPFESTICISNAWFYNSKDTTLKSVEELEKIYKVATAQDNIFILNCPPNTEGRLREADVKRLIELRKSLRKNN